MPESPSSTAPFISVLIPAFNEEALIARTIERVQQSFAQVEHPAFEIIVCDNNSTDRTSEVAQSNGARVVFEPHNQISRARNTAARHAQGEWLIFLDADTLLPAELLQSTIDTINGGGIGAGGALVEFDRPVNNHAAMRVLRFWNTISKCLKVAAGSYIYCQREAWTETRGFDETVYAGEELFFSRRLKRWGRKRGLGFRILTSPVMTSPRKLQWYGPWQLLRHTLSLARPGSMKRRENCALWYTRPDESR
jgi:glycosyltransferase involved in cell wall biosynthesis